MRSGTRGRVPVEPVESHLQLGAEGVGPLAIWALASLPPGALDEAGLLEALARCDEQLAWLASVRAGLLAEYARRDPSAGVGDWHREQLSLACSVTGGEAYRRMSTAAALAGRLPATAAALAAGSRPWEFAVAVAGQTDGLSEQAAGVVERAVLGDRQVRTPAQARRAARRAALAAAPAGRQEEEVRAGRSLEMWPEPVGGGHAGWFSLPDEQAAELAAALEALAGRQGPDDARPVGARRADALVELAAFWRAHHNCPATRSGAPGAPGAAGAAGGAGRPAPAAVTVTVELPTLLALADTPAELAGGQPLAAETARRLACDAALTRLVRDPLTGGVIDLGRAARYPSPAQRRRLEHRDPTCRFPTCHTPAGRCHAHHIHTWQDGGPTDEHNLVLLCHRHHNAVHEGGWAVRLHPDNTTTWTPPARPGEVLPPGQHPPPREPDPPLLQPRQPPPPPSPDTTGPAGTRPDDASPDRNGPDSTGPDSTDEPPPF